MKLAPLLAAAALALPSIASAHGYVRAGAAYELGAGSQPLSADDVPAFDIGLGTRIAPLLRAEVQASWRPGLASGPGGDRVSLLGMAYADFGMFGRAQPFVGLGAGAAVAPGGGGAAFAWTAQAGVGWLVSNHLTLDVALRYADQGARLATAGVGVSVRRRF